MTRQIITVDIAPEVQSDRRLKVSQYDVGRPLGVYIVRHGEPVDCSGYTAQLYICKSDGALYERVCDVNATENNLVMWETEEQESAAAGASIAEIRIKQGDVNIGTANFIEWVEESPSDMAVASHSESQSLIALIDRAEAAAETAETAISTSAASAQEAAEAATRAESAKGDAATSAESAEQSASSAFASAEAAGQSAASALQGAENAGQSASAAGQSATSALQGAESAEQSASAAGQSATSAGQSASEASRSAAEAVENATSARQSATSAWESSNMAELSASDAVGNALKSEGYAVGKQNGTDVPSTSPYYQKNAKYYSTKAEDAKNVAVAAKNSAEAVVPSVEAAGQEQIAAVAAKGQEVLDSIPADYSDLTEDVSDLNRAFNELPTEETAQELLKFEDSNAGLTETALAVIGWVFNHQPQDDTAVDIANSLSLECERLQAIYDNWISERGA